MQRGPLTPVVKMYGYTMPWNYGETLARVGIE